MPKGGYRNVTVSNELYNTLMEEAKKEYTTVPKLIEKLAAGLKSEKPVEVKARQGVPA